MNFIKSCTICVIKCQLGYSVKNQFELTGTTDTINGVTFTVNKSAGTVIATNAASPSATSTFTLGSFKLKANKTYILSGCPSGGGNSSYALYSDYLGVLKQYDTGNGVNLTATSDTTVSINCVIYTSNTTSTVTFRPMIRDASITDDTFETYKQDANSKINVTTNGIMLSSAQMAYGKRTKNLIPFVLKENVKGSSVGSTTCKRDGDGYKLTNSPTGNVVFALYTTNANHAFDNAKLPNTKTLPTGKYIISGTGFDADIQYRIQYSTDGSTATKLLYFGEGGDTSEKTFEITDAMTYVRHYIWVKSGKNLGSGVMVKPMIRDANIADSTYTEGIDAGAYMCSAINLTPEKLELDAGKLIINSDNFSLDVNGKCTLGGDSIIQSKNYVANSEGMKIQLSDGTIDSKNFKVSSDGTVTATGATINGGTFAISSSGSNYDDTPYINLNTKYTAVDNKEYSYRIGISPYQITHQYKRYSSPGGSAENTDLIYIGNNGNITLRNTIGLANHPETMIGTDSQTFGFYVPATSTDSAKHKIQTYISAGNIIVKDTAEEQGVGQSTSTTIQGSNIWCGNLVSDNIWANQTLTATTATITTANISVLDRESGYIAVRKNLTFASGTGIDLAGRTALQVYNSEVAIGIGATADKPALPLRVYASAAYTPTAWVVSSDARRKHDIESLDNRYLDIVKSIEPKRFKYLANPLDRYHTGYIAQDVQTAMKKLNVSVDELSAFVDVNGDGSDLALRYGEFIPLLHKWLKELDSRLTAIEKRKE